MRDEGIPQPFEQLCSHMRKLTRISEHIKPQDWLKHLNELRSLSVLANQATEFVYNKNRTEGKTGLIKSDLISPNLRGVVNTSASSSIEDKIKERVLKVSENDDEEHKDIFKKTEISSQDEQKTIQIQKQAKLVEQFPNKQATCTISAKKTEFSVGDAQKTDLNSPKVKITQEEKAQDISEENLNIKVIKAKPTAIKKAEPIKIITKVTDFFSYNI